MGYPKHHCSNASCAVAVTVLIYKAQRDGWVRKQQSKQGQGILRPAMQPFRADHAGRTRGRLVVVGSTVLMGQHCPGSDSGNSREQRLLQQRSLFGQPPQQVHVLDCLPRGALHQVVDHCSGHGGDVCMCVGGLEGRAL